MDIFKETKVIFADEIVQSLKTRKALLTILSYIFMMFMGLKIGSYLEVFMFSFVQLKQSFSIMLPYYVSMMLLPLFCILIGYNVIGSELSSGSIRFMAYRVRRFSILAGKTLASALVVVAMIFIAYVIAMMYIYYKVGLLYYMHSLIAWAYLSIYALCFICLTSLVSMVTRKSGSAMVWNTFIVVLFAFMLNYDYLRYFSPFYYARDALSYMIDGNLYGMLLGMCVLAIFSLVFFSLSWMIIERSDL